MAGATALFLDWGGTLARARDNRTVVDAESNPQLMPNVMSTLARVRPSVDRCFEDGCACRKPLPGMFLELAAAWSLDLTAPTHVGDQDKDRDAAAAAGIGTFIWAKDFFGW